jgi:CxxC-x17-CxxC domain-containing protein
MGFSEKGKKGKKEYRSEGSGRRNDSGGRRNGDKMALTTVKCDSCGKSCTVPFRPTEGKPVYCNDCFRKSESGSRGDRSSYSRHPGSDSRNSISDNNALRHDIAKLDAKLDQILKLLE